MQNQKIQALKAKQTEQNQKIQALKAKQAEHDAEHDARIDVIAEEVRNYYIEQRAKRGIKTVITPWNTPINEILNGAR